MFLSPRREIYAGYSRRRFIELRDQLQSQGIPISYRMTTKNDTRRTVISNFRPLTLYKLYAKPRFFEKKLGKKL